MTKITLKGSRLRRDENVDVNVLKQIGEIIWTKWSDACVTGKRHIYRKWDLEYGGNREEPRRYYCQNQKDPV
jgi:hypothetical protein